MTEKFVEKIIYNMKPVISKECSELLLGHLRTGTSVSANRCDWSNCSEMGILDGVNTVLLNAETRNNLIPHSRFVFLCPKHFKIAMANLNLDNE